MSKWLTYMVSLVLIAAHSIGYAQSSRFNDTLSVKKVIFEDDFSHDYGKRYLSKWALYPPEQIKNVDLANNRYCTIQKAGNKYALTMQTKICQCFEPIISSGPYHSDSLALDLDFFMEDYSAEITLSFCSRVDGDTSSYCSEVVFHVRNEINVGISLLSSCENEYFRDEKAGYFPANEWHHLSISFDQGSIKCTIDQHQLSSFPETGYFPSSAYFCLCGALKFTNVRLTAVNKNYPFRKILTNKKLVTHTILFDKDRPQIQPKSLGMIIQLAQFLKQNPAVKLEIASHTDNDGEPADNMKLSQDRADEIKRQLVALGIKATRLTAKGYGGTKPIQAKCTPGGKAENRRVEFIKR